VQVRPTRWDALADRLTDRIAASGTRRVLLDGAPPTAPDRLAAELDQRLRLLGRPVVTVAARDFLRPASLRLERGHRDPDEFLDGWLDADALRREVLLPAGADASAGTVEVLPRLWNPDTDRAYRAARAPLPPGGVVLLSGALLLGRDLPADLTVHLRMSPAALARRTPPELHWTLPAYARYAAEHRPDAADVLVLTDDPARPAEVL
jgi:hypothetical protein